ncbi:winged helix-turn-helix domain-containing protein [Solwaraspora sp. WMMD1047]|jgi:GntR family transcriptional regulator|uniref:winged helix-turn-helix domain-containing protein n=1 Tax=Solwaraspora sp. WMMD1047 TaxID=3016102 RepID=UPI002417D680|nr:winged helix-turn-helix domain-containing protein [Solwaraspora sp. WMMD1047]MDG4831471.1 winged helix-turn-helix domain-containing protein [Solwaraspora sp. WMMD1047]
MPTKPKWALIADHIRDQIASGQLKSGDKLPSTAQLRAEHGVSAGVVRQAVLVLQTQGLVQGVHGLGVFVADRPD